MLKIVGLCIAIAVGLILTINAAFMLASPRGWFRLPGWLRAQGTLVEQKYSSGWGAVQLRLTGGLILIAVAWVVYDLFLRRV
ncbi:MAG TPA: hypothetical protein VMF56_05515 [Acidobacteriaceae bacterium]|nr:hypothetical protein [Acidobacteriaceae bacterium]